MLQGISELPEGLVENAHLLQCPACGGELQTSVAANSIVCSVCALSYPVMHGIPHFFCMHEKKTGQDVTEIVRTFYEEYPFPTYEEIDTKGALRIKAQQSLFAHQLDEQIPYDSRVLEVGCGTGQLSNFLGMSWGRIVFGADFCLTSLGLGHEFKLKNGIDNTLFIQMNLFKPVFKPEIFDLVICNGVLHHTGDPYQGFQSIARLLKPGGMIVVGLYNTFGRVATDIRRTIFSFFGRRLQFLDARLRDKSLSSDKKDIWFMDQYANPHECKLSFGDVIAWFERSDFEFVRSIPSTSLGASLSPTASLFQGESKGTRFERALVQTGMLLRGGKDGGLFIMIGRKNT